MPNGWDADYFENSAFNNKRVINSSKMKMKMENKECGRISLVLDKSYPEYPVFVLKENQTVGGFGWEIQELKTTTYLEEMELKLEFSVHCKNSSGTLFLAQAEINVIIGTHPFVGTHQFGNGGFGETNMHYFFNGEENVKFERRLYYDANDPNPNEQYVDIEISVLRSCSSLVKLDTHLEITWDESQENGELKQKNEVIAVNKHMLAANSEYFDRLFFAKWLEGSQQQFKIKEEDYVALKRMIYTSMLGIGCLLIGNKKFECLLFGSTNDKNVKFNMAIDMLKLSDKYNMPMIRNFCEDYLALQFEKGNDMSKIEFIVEMEKFGFHNLKARILASMNSNDLCKELRKNFQILVHLDSQTRDEVLNQVEKSACNNSNGRSGY